MPVGKGWRLNRILPMICLSTIWLWSVIISSATSASLKTATSCRPALPVDWFISRAKSPSSLSQFVNNSIATASANFTTFIEREIPGTTALSVIVAAPWGPIFTYNYGKLRQNDTSNPATVDGDSIYRLGTMSKACFFPFFSNNSSRYYRC